MLLFRKGESSAQFFRSSVLPFFIIAGLSHVATPAAARADDDALTVTAVTWSGSVLSPNDDGIQDSMTIQAWLVIDHDHGIKKYVRDRALGKSFKKTFDVEARISLVGASAATDLTWIEPLAPSVCVTRLGRVMSVAEWALRKGSDDEHRDKKGDKPGKHDDDSDDEHKNPECDLFLQQVSYELAGTSVALPAGPYSADLRLQLIETEHDDCDDDESHGAEQEHCELEREVVGGETLRHDLWVTWPFEPTNFVNDTVFYFGANVTDGDEQRGLIGIPLLPALEISAVTIPVPVQVGFAVSTTDPRIALLPDAVTSFTTLVTSSANGWIYGLPLATTAPPLTVTDAAQFAVTVYVGLGAATESLKGKFIAWWDASRGQWVTVDQGVLDAVRFEQRLEAARRPDGRIDPFVLPLKGQTVTHEVDVSWAFGGAAPATDNPFEVYDSADIFGAPLTADLSYFAGETFETDVTEGELVDPSYTVQGFISYFDTLLQKNRPLDGATVQVWDKDAVKDDPVCSAVTLANGFFRCTGNASDFGWFGLGSTRADLYIVARTRNKSLAAVHMPPDFSFSGLFSLDDHGLLRLLGVIGKTLKTCLSKDAGQKCLLTILNSRPAYAGKSKILDNVPGGTVWINITMPETESQYHTWFNRAAKVIRRVSSAAWRVRVHYEDANGNEREATLAQRFQANPLVIGNFPALSSEFSYLHLDYPFCNLAESKAVTQNGIGLRYCPNVGVRDYKTDYPNLLVATETIRRANDLLSFETAVGNYVRLVIQQYTKTGESSEVVSEGRDNNAIAAFFTPGPGMDSYAAFNYGIGMHFANETLYRSAAYPYCVAWDSGDDNVLFRLIGRPPFVLPVYFCSLLEAGPRYRTGGERDALAVSAYLWDLVDYCNNDNSGNGRCDERASFSSEDGVQAADHTSRFSIADYVRALDEGRRSGLKIADFVHYLRDDGYSVSCQQFNDEVVTAARLNGIGTVARRNCTPPGGGGGGGGGSGGGCSVATAPDEANGFVCWMALLVFWRTVGRGRCRSRRP
ncbi:MAG: hypothetical protein D6761_09530 [Candidatus Dadabacteria bacterium]|nr:MAG: hypothetical protein D6761_09530 [Candidatus Dadabacteria bacterium]